jgi:hypothetical protein
MAEAAEQLLAATNWLPRKIRRKQWCVANTFLRRGDAKKWSIESERSIDKGRPSCAAA